MIRVQRFTVNRGFKDSWLIKESAGWIPDSMGTWSVGVGRRHPVAMTMRKVSFKILVYKASVSAATPDWCAVLSC